MPLIESTRLKTMLAPPVDSTLAAQLVAEFCSLELRFVQRDWGPAELDAGQFCEVAGRILYQLDSAQVNTTKDLKSCIGYIENDQVTHLLLPRHDAIHLASVVKLTYKFRSQRGGIHITPNYTANEMDSKWMIECVRWAMTELLRIASRADRNLVVRTVKEILRFEVPAIGRFEELILVQRTDLSAEEEILLLLHYAGEEGFSRKQLGEYAMISAPSVTVAIQKLCSPKFRQVVLIESRYRLTDIGVKRVREQLADKLALQ